MSRADAKSSWLRHVDQRHLRDMALHIWGPDCEAMMREFQPSAGLLMQYQNSILDCGVALAGKRVLDMGCNNGLYSYLAMRHGAGHVVGVEPRGMFVDGLNSFARQHQMPMEFVKGYDTDVSRLIRQHDIDTVLLLGMDELINWEHTMQEIRKSTAQWLVMRMTSIPDRWIEFNSEVLNFAKHGAGMPVGFTLHYEGHNSNTRGGINPVHRDRADPDTGYQHIDPDGKLDQQSSRVSFNRRSQRYISRFIDICGYRVENSKKQEEPTLDSPALPASFGLYQWYMLHNQKQ